MPDLPPVVRSSPENPPSARRGCRPLKTLPLRRPDGLVNGLSVHAECRNDRCGRHTTLVHLDDSGVELSPNGLSIVGLFERGCPAAIIRGIAGARVDSVERHPCRANTHVFEEPRKGAGMPPMGLGAPALADRDPLGAVVAIRPTRLHVAAAVHVVPASVDRGSRHAVCFPGACRAPLTARCGRRVPDALDRDLPLRSTIASAQSDAPRLSDPRGWSA